MRLLFVLSIVVLAACASAAPAATPAPTTAAALPTDTTSVDDAADEICREHAWIGIRAGVEFTAEAEGAGVAPGVLTGAVRRACPDTWYEPLSQAEIDWCGDGLGFGRNFFTVVAAGVDAGVESFTVVDPGLVSKAAAGRELTDYEIELLTAGLQTLTESSRFDRDWASACRLTF
ncbi:MAG: hypothetical protein HKO70_02910 [Acidimicrobiia bacterium]|nr:hypothetical protein [Acidimicrobiia bacterium]